ncbi:lipoprotein [Pseudomonas sp. Pc102]|uniref:PqiC family protein n=1 Tax=Pseudomonas sp. Pc102 TaxID=2678261 RepID=UPI001BD17CD1|nr:PqiC family protein [Pseudomonas sp. Pc102]BBP83112.1 lipoprotein [Pseudomonas sp. Pc102]
MAVPIKLVLSAALLLLAACRSDPINFHTLTPLQAGDGRPAGADIQIEGISVPPQVDRPQIVIRQGDSGLVILETEWWGASLVDELSSALENQLANSSLPRRASVRLDVQRFDSVPGRYALLDVRWRLRPTDAGDKALLSCRSTLQTPAGPSIDALVIAHQKNIERLAEAIVRTTGSDKGQCP